MYPFSCFVVPLPLMVTPPLIHRDQYTTGIGLFARYVLEDGDEFWRQRGSLVISTGLGIILPLCLPTLGHCRCDRYVIRWLNRPDQKPKS